MKSNLKNETFFKNLATAYVERDGKHLKENELQEAATISAENLDKKLHTRLNPSRFRKWSLALVPLAAGFLIFFVYMATSHNFDNFRNEQLGIMTATPEAERDFIAEEADVADDNAFVAEDGGAADADDISSSTFFFRNREAWYGHGETTEEAEVIEHPPLTVREFFTGFTVQNVSYEEMQNTYYLTNTNHENIILIEEFEKNILDINEHFEAFDIGSITAYLLVSDNEYILTFLLYDIRYTLISTSNSDDLFILSENIISSR
ncbi:MAG: hypothetical protein FWE25_05930 [Lachnospiraceae bacterium]|nr:hypothetical protein [Lachnospiraceae bacterium]